MDRKFTIPGKCLMSNNCRFISKLGLHGHKRRIVMEEFLPEPGRAKYIGPFYLVQWRVSPGCQRDGPLHHAGVKVMDSTYVSPH